MSDATAGRRASGTWRFRVRSGRQEDCCVTLALRRRSWLSASWPRAGVVTVSFSAWRFLDAQPQSASATLIGCRGFRRATCVVSLNFPTLQVKRHFLWILHFGRFGERTSALVAVVL